MAGSSPLCWIACTLNSHLKIAVLLCCSGLLECEEVERPQQAGGQHVMQHLRWALVLTQIPTGWRMHRVP